MYNEQFSLNFKVRNKENIEVFEFEISSGTHSLKIDGMAALSSFLSPSSSHSDVKKKSAYWLLFDQNLRSQYAGETFFSRKN